MSTPAKTTRIRARLGTKGRWLRAPGKPQTGIPCVARFYAVEVSTAYIL